MRVAPRTSWFVETRGVTIMGANGEALISLPYPHAGLWALVGSGEYSSDQAIELMGILMSVDDCEAQREVDATMACWLRAGIVVED